MYVLIGRTQIEDHEIIQLQYALEDREAVLKKAISAAENARLPTQAASADLETCKRLAALLDPASHDREETRRTQLDAFEHRESQPVDEALDEAEKEAARLLEERKAWLRKQLRQHEIDRALRAIMVADPELAAFSDEDMAECVEARLDEVRYVDREHNLPGVFRHETEDGKTVWCYVSTEGGVLRFWYDVQLFADDAPHIAFDEKNAPATYVGEALLARIRRALAPDPDVRRIEEGSEEPEAQEPEETETAAAGV